MDFVIDREHQLLRKMYREFAENEVKPIAAEIDEEERFPEETIKKMAKLGMMGLYFPKEYGGAGADILAYAMAVEEMAKVCTTTSVALSAHVSLCTAPIFENGTEEQKQKYLPKLCSGEWLGAFGLTEPGAGTDAQGQQTVAVLDESGENWMLNGSKIFITNAGYADVFIIIAVTGTIIDKRGKKEQGNLRFCCGAHGLPASPSATHEKKMGIRGSSTCELIFEDCVVPKENLLGEQGKGFKIAMKTLDGGRIGIAAQALGIAEGAIDETVKYAKERMQFGKRICQFQNTQFQLADMQTRDGGCPSAGLHGRLQAKQDGTSLTATGRCYGQAVCLGGGQSKSPGACLQLLGGYGYTREYPVERMMRDAKITEIYEGTSEVQRMVISAHMGVK